MLVGNQVFVSGSIFMGIQRNTALFDNQIDEV